MFFLSLIFIGASHAAEPVTVAGIVLDENTPANPIPGCNVGLYPNDQKVEDEQLSNDTTTSDWTQLVCSFPCQKFGRYLDRQRPRSPGCSPVAILIGNVFGEGFIQIINS
jgi:hypothetical protein